MTQNAGHALDASATRTEGILVGYDGSDASGRAVRWAAAEAVRRGRPLTVLHAVDTWGIEIDHGVAPDDWSRRAMAAGGAVADQGAGLAADAAEGVNVRRMLGDGPPARLLVEQSRDAELVVVGNRGRGALASAWFGSVSLAVATHADCPTVVVGSEAAGPLGPGHPVVVGVDGSPAAVEALDAAAALADGSGSSLRVVSVWDPLVEQGWGPLRAGAVAGGSYGIDEALRTGARKATADAEARVRQTHPGLPVTTVVAEGVAAQALADAAADAGVIVVGSRGHGAFAGLVLGSVSHGVVHRARCPVMIVHRAGSTQPTDRPEALHVII